MSVSGVFYWPRKPPRKFRFRGRELDFTSQLEEQKRICNQLLSIMDIIPQNRANKERENKNIIEEMAEKETHFRRPQVKRKNRIELTQYISQYSEDTEEWRPQGHLKLRVKIQG